MRFQIKYDSTRTGGNSLVCDTLCTEDCVNTVRPVCAADLFQCAAKTDEEECGDIEIRSLFYSRNISFIKRE